MKCAGTKLTCETLADWGIRYYIEGNFTERKLNFCQGSHFCSCTRSLNPKLLSPTQYTEIVPVPAINRQKSRAMFFPAFSNTGTLGLVQRTSKVQGLRYLSRSAANMAVRCYFDIAIGGNPKGRIEFEVPS